MITISLKELSRLGVLRDLDIADNVVFDAKAFTEEFIKDCGNTEVLIDECQLTLGVGEIEDINLIFAVNLQFQFPDDETEIMVKLKWF